MFAPKLRLICGDAGVTDVNRRSQSTITQSKNSLQDSLLHPYRFGQSDVRGVLLPVSDSIWTLGLLKFGSYGVSLTLRRQELKLSKGSSHDIYSEIGKLGTGGICFSSFDVQTGCTVSVAIGKWVK